MRRGWKQRFGRGSARLRRGGRRRRLRRAVPAPQAPRTSGSRRASSSPPTTSAAPGTGTATRAPAATSRPPTTRTASTPSSRRDVDVVGEVRHAARDPALPAARRRQVRPAPRHPTSRPASQSADVGRRGIALARAHRPRRRHHVPLLRDGDRLPVDAEGASTSRAPTGSPATCTSPAAGRTRASTSPASGSPSSAPARRASSRSRSSPSRPRS